MRTFALVLAFLAACSVEHTGLGPEVDASTTPCASDIDCNGDAPCTTYTCEDGTCRSSGCLAGFTCEGDRCTARSSCNEASCRTGGIDPARCAVGVCQGDSCASVSTCMAEELCCGSGCIPCEPFPAFSCKRRACDGDECGETKVEEGTECYINGQFCEGHGTCDGAGNCDAVRCQRDCDPLRRECVGCIDDAGCPDIVTGRDCFGSLAFEQCSGSVIPMRQARTCENSVCVPRGAPVADMAISCARMDQVECGPVIVSDPDQCTYDDATCSETGTTIRTITDSICMGGACNLRNTPEELPNERMPDVCNRSTEDEPCGATPTAPIIGDCGGFTGICGESGTQSVQRFRSSCGSGTCDPSGNPEAPTTRPCTRDQAGVSCGSVMMGPWTTCTRTSQTACVGSRSRTITTPTCMNGGCRMVDTTFTDTNCRIDDGTSCGSVGPCDEDPGNGSVCIGRERTPICMAGSCLDDNFEPCDRIGNVCMPAEDGECVPEGTTCTGMRTPVEHRCIAGGGCEDTDLPPVECDVDSGTTCGSLMSCSQGVCDASGACTTTVDCTDNSACGSSCTAPETCGCSASGDGTCACM